MFEFNTLWTGKKLKEKHFPLFLLTKVKILNIFAFIRGGGIFARR